MDNSVQLLTPGRRFEKNEIRFVRILFASLRRCTLFVTCRLNDMLAEYTHMVRPLPAPIAPMLRPFTDRVDEAVNPGIVALTWTSIKIDECK